MKKFLIIFMAIIIAAPLSSLLLNVISHLMALPESLQKDYYEYWPFWEGVFIGAVYEVPIYIVVGIPVTLLIDFVLKLTKTTSTKKLYLFQLFLYILSATIVAGLFLSVEYIDIGVFIPVVIAVLTYFHILLYLRKRFNKKNRELS